MIRYLILINKKFDIIKTNEILNKKRNSNEFLILSCEI